MTPEKIGRYEVREELGRGGMATVFLAYDPHFERNVAVKVLPREFLHEPEFRARFVREAKTIAALEHPAIVPVYDFGEDGGQPYLVMRHMPGGSLTDRLAEGPMSTEETARILKRIGSALDQAHRQGIVHRDLKPSNILFDQFGEAYLADFGIVRITSSSAALTASGSLVGTPAYMSPEQVYGDKELDGRSDIYALGVILFQMLTGSVPFSAETPARMMMKHVMDPVPLVGEKRPDLPVEYDAVINRAMAKDRDARFPTATEMAAAIDVATQRTARPSFAATPIAEMPEIDVSVAPTEVLSPGSGTQESPAEEIPIPSPALEKKSGRINIPIWVWGALVALVVVCVASIAGASWLIRNEGLAFLGFGETSTPTPGVSPSAITTPLPTRSIDDTTATEMAAGRLATATAVAAALAVTTPEAGETARAADTPEVGTGTDATRDSIIAARETLAAQSASATPAPIDRVTTELQPLFGPSNGGLVHVPDDFIETSNAGVEVRDFVAQVLVTNPFAAASGLWDFGLIFRQAELDEELRLVIRSDGVWNLNDRHGEADNFVGEGDLKDALDLQDSGVNKLMVISQGDRGYFFVNDGFIAPLDLSARLSEGDIAIGTGFYGGSEREGASTGFSDFAIWPLSPAFGPRSNQLDHVDDDTVKVRGAEVGLANFMAEASFRNPYDASRGGWDVGFSFRNAEAGDKFWLIVDSNLGWTLINRRSGQDQFVDEGTLDGLNVQAGGSNHLTLVASGRTGYFFVNDGFVAQLNLASRLNSGDVEVVTAFFVGDEIAGETTAYQNFTVWPLP